jgi:hypothetical protein
MQEKSIEDINKLICTQSIQNTIQYESKMSRNNLGDEIKMDIE